MAAYRKLILKAPFLREQKKHATWQQLKLWGVVVVVVVVAVVVVVVVVAAVIGVTNRFEVCSLAIFQQDHESVKFHSLQILSIFP